MSIHVPWKEILVQNRNRLQSFSFSPLSCPWSQLSAVGRICLFDKERKNISSQPGPAQRAREIDTSKTSTLVLFDRCDSVDGERQLPEKVSRRSLLYFSSIRGTFHRSAAMKVRLVASSEPGAVFELIRVLRRPLRRPLLDSSDIVARRIKIPIFAKPHGEVNKVFLKFL